MRCFLKEIVLSKLKVKYIYSRQESKPHGLDMIANHAEEPDMRANHMEDLDMIANHACRRTRYES